MKDFKGNEVNVGDKVVFYVQTSTSGGHMTEGTVVEIKTDRGMERAVVEHKYQDHLDWTCRDNVMSRKIFKI